MDHFVKFGLALVWGLTFNPEELKIPLTVEIINAIKQKHGLVSQDLFGIFLFF